MLSAIGAVTVPVAISLDETASNVSIRLSGRLPVGALTEGFAMSDAVRDPKERIGVRNGPRELFGATGAKPAAIGVGTGLVFVSAMSGDTA
ncbi:hypothetical protein [Jannaschia seohaensis]|uniref:hypothetical protein n=1 Tax=Jannaschia seohaensis TaxID=475081 RepID=UPI001475E2C1|nr:hypothetical protein [Jannaschia seohaensis]